MRFSRNQTYLVGIGMIILLVLMNKFYFLIRSEHAKGEIVDTYVRRTSGKYAGSYFHPRVKFTADNNDITFTGVANLNYKLGDKVDVVYLKSDITNARVFSLTGFWIPGFIYALIPFFILSGAVYSFIDPDDIVKINFDEVFSIKISKRID